MAVTYRSEEEVQGFGDLAVIEGDAMDEPERKTRERIVKIRRILAGESVDEADDGRELKPLVAPFVFCERALKVMGSKMEVYSGTGKNDLHDRLFVRNALASVAADPLKSCVIRQCVVYCPLRLSAGPGARGHTGHGQRRPASVEAPVPGPGPRRRRPRRDAAEPGRRPRRPALSGFQQRAVAVPQGAGQVPAVPLLLTRREVDLLHRAQVCGAKKSGKVSKDQGGSGERQLHGLGQDPEGKG
mmetsp:Transcript_13390/g.37022  ORF Transcript_13390/g.37022 Transcript_13390/m.37022 type:complete len:243 (-) Transcript_13390:1946-2674(-)